jgi:hypothetical protein
MAHREGISNFQQMCTLTLSTTHKTYKNNLKTINHLYVPIISCAYEYLKTWDLNKNLYIDIK